jgi:hypothetical protein
MINNLYMLSKLTKFVKSHQYHLFLVLCIGLISFISFNLGKISQNDQKPLKVSENANIYNAVAGQGSSKDPADSPQASGSQAPKPTPKPIDLRVVVSKNSDKYHYSWCSTWKRIKPENQIWFNTEQEAIDAGYALAGNCVR